MCKSWGVTGVKAAAVEQEVSESHLFSFVFDVSSMGLVDLGSLMITCSRAGLCIYLTYIG
jgi:hypothetical protein